MLHGHFEWSVGSQRVATGLGSLDGAASLKIFLEEDDWINLLEMRSGTEGRL